MRCVVRNKLTSRKLSFVSLTLALLVLGVFANNVDAAEPLHNLALLAHRFDTGAYFHRCSTNTQIVLIIRISFGDIRTISVFVNNYLS